MAQSSSSSLELAGKSIADLVKRFAHNLDAYSRADYKETEVRHEYIDPFFEALGWDIHNRAGHDEQYKDVIHEESVRVGAGIKAPDYTFRLGREQVLRRGQKALRQRQRGRRPCLPAPPLRLEHPPAAQHPDRHSGVCRLRLHAASQPQRQSGR